MNQITSVTRTRINNVLNASQKHSLRSVSLLAPSIPKDQAKNLKISFDFESFQKTQKRTPPSKPLSLNQSTEEIKPVVALTPSQVLLNHYHKLNEFEYKEVNNYPEIYYFGQTKRKYTGKFCDEKLYFKSFVGDHIAYRYEIQRLLGDGSFGLVLQCFDHKTLTNVAVKVLRKGKKFSKIGETEAKVLDILRIENDDEAIVKKLDQFKFRGHFFIIYELLSLDLFQFLKKNDFRGANPNIVKRISVQIIIALKHIHESGFIHCDLKPENILFKAENKLSIKIIDFGSACEKNNKIYTYIQSRFYRAPEVMLETGYSEKIDMWSLGCILYELYKGVPIFQGANELEQLGKIVEIIGEIPEPMALASKRKEFYFNEELKLKDKNGGVVKPAVKTIPSLIKNAEKNFIDFLIECLKIDPNERIDAESALSHPWIKCSKQTTRSFW